jgi:hypothetical protein
MRTFALLVLAAIAFSLLAGVLELSLARQARRRWLEKSSLLLHPLTRHGFPRLRSSAARRGLHHVELFLGFLVATYVGLVLLKTVHRLLAQWFS